MVIIICTLVPRKGSTACWHIPFNPCSHCWLTVKFLLVQLLIVHFLCNCKHSLLSFIILWATLSPSSYNYGFHTLFSSIVHEQTPCHTHKHMQFLCRYTASTNRSSFQDQLRSFGNHNENKVSFSSKWLQDMYNCAAINMALRNGYAIFHCYEYHSDSLN